MARCKKMAMRAPPADDLIVKKRLRTQTSTTKCVLHTHCYMMNAWVSYSCLARPDALLYRSDAISSRKEDTPLKKLAKSCAARCGQA